MSAQAETEPHSTIHAGARMYGNYVVEDLKCHTGQSHEAKKAEGNPFFEASMEFARTLQIHHPLTADELGQTPEMDAVVDSIVKLPAQWSKLNKYAQMSLFHASGLVANRVEHIQNPLQKSVYDHAVNHAIFTRDMLQDTSERTNRQVAKLKHAMGSAVTLALLTKQGFAMPALPHQLIDYRCNPHDGVLLRAADTPVSAAYLFAVVDECAGYTEGHTAENRRTIRGKYLKRTRILSTCCDLKLPDEEGPQDVDTLVNLLQRDVANEDVLPEEKDWISKLGRSLVDALLNGEGRRGMSLTPGQRRRATYVDAAFRK